MRIDPTTIPCPHAFVAKLNLRGSGLTYLTYLGGSNYDFAFDIAADGNGNAYVVGATGSNNFPVAEAIQGAFTGGTCSSRVRVSGTKRPFSFPCPTPFVTKLNPTGTALAYSTYLGGHGGDMAYLGGNGGDIGFGIAVDSAGSASHGSYHQLELPHRKCFPTHQCRHCECLRGEDLGSNCCPQYYQPDFCGSGSRYNQRSQDPDFE